MLFCPSDTESAGAFLSTPGLWVDPDGTVNLDQIDGLELPDTPTVFTPPASGLVRSGDVSYTYLSWAVPSNEWLVPASALNVLVGAHINAMVSGERDEDLTVTHPGNTTIAPNTELTGLRFREGMERFYITDINNPASTAKAQSDLPLVWDVLATQVDIFNHIPGGANVLYMDGHVEFLKYSQASSDFPVTAEMATLTTMGHNL